MAWERPSGVIAINWEGTKGGTVSLTYTDNLFSEFRYLIVQEGTTGVIAMN